MVRSAAGILLLAALLLFFPKTSAAFITATELATGSSSVHTDTYTTQSITPAPYNLILVWVANTMDQSVDTPSISGNGLTWSKIKNVQFSTTGTPMTLTLFRSMGASPSSGPLTFTFGHGQANCSWTVIQFDKVLTTGSSGANAVVRNVSSADDGVNGAYTITMSALRNLNNGTAAGFANNSNTMTADSGSSGTSALATASGPNASLMAEWYLAGTQSVVMNNSAAQNIAGIAVEIAAQLTTTLGDGTEPGNATIAPGAGATMAGSFTFQCDHDGEYISALKLSLGTGVGSQLSLVEITDETGSTVYGSLANPFDTPTITLTTPISVTPTLTSYRIRITPKAQSGMLSPPGALYNVTARVTAWTDETTYHAGSDSAGTTIIIDNLSPGEVTGATGVVSNGQLNLGWTNPSDTDLSAIVVLRRVGGSVSCIPVEGVTYSVGFNFGSCTVQCVLSTPGSTCSDTELATGTTYYYKIFAKDSNGNYSSGISVGPIAAGTIIGDDTEPGSATIAPGSGPVLAGSFTFQTNLGTADISSVKLSLGSSTSGFISLVEITDPGGNVYGALSNPGVTPTVNLSTHISATLTPSSYRIRITPQGQSAMTSPPGGLINVTAQVTSWTDTNSIHTGSDNAGSTITIDNLSPGLITGPSGVSRANRVDLSWTNPGDADLDSIVIVQRIGSNVDRTPAEGTAYHVGDSLGNGNTVVCVVTSPGSSCSDTGLINGTTYYYKIWSKDTSGNYSATGVILGSLTPRIWQPDAMIKLYTEAATAYLGSNLYETSASTQVKSQAVLSGATASYNVRFQNDAAASDTIVIRGTGSGSNFTVQYLDPSSVDRTASVTGAGHTTASLSSGAFQDWTVKVTPAGGSGAVAGGTSYPVYVTATSGTDNTSIEQVKALTTSSSANVSLVMSSDKGAARPGEDVTYTTTASNGAGLNSAAAVIWTQAIPSNTGLKVGGATFNAGTSSLSASVSYSNGSWGYSPVSGGCGAPAGYDYCVTQIKWTMTGTMPGGTNCACVLVLQVK